MKIKLYGILFCALVTNVMAQKKGDVAVQARISSILSKMSLEEKIAMVHANGLFSSAGVKRLGIPDLVSADGPLGVREEVKPGWGSANLTTDSATFFPNGSAVAATWNPELAYRFGHDMGEEARARGKHIMLAPAFNITRTPLNGRTYEYYSEDPLLNSRLAVSAVKGIQSQHVAACIKHFAVNNQEINRGVIDVNLDERALHEIYLPAFKAAVVEGDAWTLMTAYNKLRGVYCSENDYLLNQILKKAWKFQGLVMSDWGGTHSTVAAAKYGLDLEMGSGENYDKYFFAEPLLKAVKDGHVNIKVIDDKVRRILWVMMKTSLSPGLPKGKMNTTDHSKTVYDIAAESIVLLKNTQNLLPLQLNTLKRIAVIGDNATRTFHLGGFGAGVKARYEVTGLQGLKNRLPSAVAVHFAQGYTGSYRPAGDISVNTETHGADATLIKEAVEVAKQSDVAILFVGGNRDYESESRDRKDLSLPFGEQALVDAVTAVNPKTIVIVVGGAPYDLNAIKKNNHTILWSWYNGSENGNALADVLLGKVNPSGKLPFTFPAQLEDVPAHAFGLDVYPGRDLKQTYKEGILVGYRWFDTKQIEPLFPFGYGLSYTKFELSALTVGKPTYKQNETINVRVEVRNTGGYSGKETVQLYVSKLGSKVERAEKELKGFKKVNVEAGKSTIVSIQIPVKDLAYFDVKSKEWIIEPGRYRIAAGASSRQISATEIINVL